MTKTRKLRKTPPKWATNLVPLLNRWAIFKIRMAAIWMILTNRLFGAVVVSKAEVKDGKLQPGETKTINNIKGMWIFMVPVDAGSIDRTIKRLKKLRADLVHTSEYNNVVSMRNTRKGGEK
ncbi:MAG: hypothetical protein RLN88_04120 [Ekhidna sp.]|uniref:hypothetical protein n=1 Tax=Ekhidna sp. TaxID=2608089 RepID=UPI0032EE5474